MEEIDQRFLDFLEAEESKLIAWGIVDSGFTKAELLKHAETILGEDESEDKEKLVDVLLDSCVLFEFNIRGRRVFRTRMAESVRLFSRLRQIFPYRSWINSPALVADFRFSHRSRVYPARLITPDQVVGSLKSEGLLSESASKIIKAILSSPDRGSLNLADFQLRATATMLRDLRSKKSRGMIISAGTGTGKTLAFYLPALTHIASLIGKTDYWTKALAIYPRSELLKDQFSETYIEARRLDPILMNNAGRKLLIGTYFSNTPFNSSLNAVKLAKWPVEGARFVCPFLRCPACGGQLGWDRVDIENGIERLNCTSNTCSAVVEQDVVVLSRERMKSVQPDVLFTTTEMVNRQISDSDTSHIFGVNSSLRPQLVLLDEIHTYTGTHGAQVANLLRRWQHAVGAKVHFTGLSATLRNATDFFASLTGLTNDAVQEISANSAKQTETRGTEYQLALRGDPVSGTSLLSTSIQAAMLLRRVLDPWVAHKDHGEYGRRVFVFTDDLDVTNRLYHNLLDAEGLNSWRRPLPGRQPLANLRTHAAPAAAERLIAGQSWLMCEEIGHTLSAPLYVGRTSSQDLGVERGADVIVATAALEVGFNDPYVGAVIQHKAPRDMASFLQRRGRAGRPRGMRPWTVVVLSDYGRDRLAYQGYDLLFDPLLEERTLPIKNRYVLRIQSVFAFMDWMAGELRRTGVRGGKIWEDFAGPSTWKGTQARQERCASAIRKILTNPESRRSLEDHLKSALVLTEDDVWAMMWEPPRSLMTAVLPTLLRRLESGWKVAQFNSDAPKQDFTVKDTPLPDFLPPNLFSDLSVPEVQITAKAQRQVGGDTITASMPIVQAMKEFSPGRVSRRFGYQQSSSSHWIALPNSESGEQELAVENYCTDFEEAGTFQYEQAEEVLEVRCVRPRALELEMSPTEVAVTSNAFPIWRTQIIPSDEGTVLDFPENSVWAGIIKDIRFFVHNDRSHVEVRRFSLGSRATVSYGRRGQRARELEATVRFTDSGLQAAVGFGQTVDGLVFRFEIPATFDLSADDHNQAKLRSFRTAYFKHRILREPKLDGYANEFQREWLFQVYLSALTSTALENAISLEKARDVLRSQVIGNKLADVLNVIFQTLDVDEPQQTNTADVVEARRQPSHEKILGLCQTSHIVDTLDGLAEVLWKDPDDDSRRWAMDRLGATLGQALLEACLQLCPHFNSGDLILDVHAGPRSPEAPQKPRHQEEIWITESTLGGGGVIEEVLRRYSADPRSFFQLAETALEPSDFEIVDSELTRLLELMRVDKSIPVTIDEFRRAYGNEETRDASEKLRRVLSNAGVLCTHAVMTALNARILRPGSNPATDEFLYRLISGWKQEEERLGIEIDARVYAYVTAATDKTLDAAFRDYGLPAGGGVNWRFNTMYGLLWPRGNSIRARALSSYNPFADIPDSDRELLLDILRPAESQVTLEDRNWREQVARRLEQEGVVSLFAKAESLSNLKLALLELAGEPIQIGFLHLYPQVEGFFREAYGYVVRLKLREAVQ